MIIKGKSRGNGAQLGRYLITKGENESIRLIEIRGVIASTVPEALLEMDALAQGTRTKKPIYSASINTPAEERLTDEQRLIAVDRLEKALGLAGQPRVIVVHAKPDRNGQLREHCHIAWSRINLTRMAAIPDSKNYHTHEKVARELEREFGLKRVQGVLAERDGQARPERTPTHAELSQTARGAFSPRDAKRLVTELWRSTDSGMAFKAALEHEGWILARGDRRDFVIIDPNGGTHSLARRVEGAKAKDIRARMADVDPTLLPNVVEARTIQQQRRLERGPIGSEVLPDRPPPLPDPTIERDEAKTLPPLEWTDRGGMVAQQRSAYEALCRIERITPATPSTLAAGPAHAQAPTLAEMAEEHRKKFDWILDPSTPDRNERDENDRSHSRDRGGRGRTR